MVEVENSIGTTNEALGIAKEQLHDSLIKGRSSSTRRSPLLKSAAWREDRYDKNGAGRTSVDGRQATRWPQYDGRGL